MKKKIFGLAVVVMALVASVAVFANSAVDYCDLVENIKHSVSAQGKGGCRHAGCKCTWYQSAHTGGKCVCGHWDYVHN